MMVYTGMFLKSIKIRENINKAICKTAIIKCIGEDLCIYQSSKSVLPRSTIKLEFKH
jgi:hypothetical protein